MTIDTEILFERRGTAGIATLNRPQALNAVTHGMVRSLARKLSEWAKDASVTRVIIRANSERAFSAGGDIRALYDLGRGRHQQDALRFWREEYTLNALIKHYPKPYIALIEGLVMGGGVGLSVHGSHRIAGDRFQFAMPEVGIGFFPDVGATWFLPRMPGQTGTYCALTGERLKVADAVEFGIATHHVKSARWPELLEALTGHEPVDKTVTDFAATVGVGPVSTRRESIDRLFEGNTVEEILRALDDETETRGWDAGFAGATGALMRAKSPTSLKIALAQMRSGPKWSFSECMRAEFRIVSRIVYGHDFYEGVRAVIIDKDQKPTWRPDRLSEVTESSVQRHFEPLGATELVLP